MCVSRRARAHGDCSVAASRTCRSNPNCASCGEARQDLAMNLRCHNARLVRLAQRSCAHLPPTPMASSSCRSPSRTTIRRRPSSRFAIRIEGNCRALLPVLSPIAQSLRLLTVSALLRAALPRTPPLPPSFVCCIHLSPPDLVFSAHLVSSRHFSLAASAGEQGPTAAARPEHHAAR